MLDAGPASRAGILQTGTEALGPPSASRAPLKGEPDGTASEPGGAATRDEGSGTPGPLPPAGRGLGWLALVALAAALALLAVAEVDWLHRLPSEPSRRVSVVVLSVAGGSQPAGGGMPTWTPEALALARDPAVLKAAAARAGHVGPDWLASHLHVQGTCVQTTAPGKPPRVGLLVYATVHGPAESRLRAIAEAWARAYIEHANSSLAGARAQRQEALMEPIRECDGQERRHG